MAPSTARSIPKAYLVKEIQKVIAFVICNHMVKRTSMKKQQQYELFFNHYHGLRGLGSNDPENIPFVQQALEGLSVFSCLFDMDDTPFIGRLTGSPIRPVRYKINPLLIPGADGPIYMGTGPSADIRLEHLEVANVTGKSSTLITGRTLLRMSDSVKGILRKIEPLVAECLNSDGTLPSGTELEDFLANLAAKIVEYKARGQFQDDTDDGKKNSDDDNPPDGDGDAAGMETLTQGAAASQMRAEQQNQSKWSHKMIPIAGWVPIALFCSMGIARKELEDKLPLLKNSDYGKQDKTNHSRIASRKEDRISRSRASGGGLAAAGFDTKDHLLASAVSMFADSSETYHSTEEINIKRDQMRLLHNQMSTVQWKIDRYIAMDRQCSHLFEEHESLEEQLKTLRKEMDALIAERSSKRKSDDSAESAQKMARYVTREQPDGMIPASVCDNSTKVSGLHTPATGSRTSEETSPPASPKRIESEQSSLTTAGINTNLHSLFTQEHNSLG